jgi:hypothetical protein
MVKDCQPQHKERQNAKRPTGDADNLLFICAISFVPEPMEAGPYTIDQTWICLTPCHSGLSPNHDPRGRFVPGRLNKGKT